MRAREQIAIDVLQASIAWEPEVRVVANVTASELAALAAAVIDTCPSPRNHDDDERGQAPRGRMNMSEEHCAGCGHHKDHHWHGAGGFRCWRGCGCKGMQQQQDRVNRPAHYTAGGVETIDAIEAWGLGFRLGNVVKYVSRAGKKDPARTVEDLEKARWYLDREIAALRGDK